MKTIKVYFFPSIMKFLFSIRLYASLLVPFLPIAIPLSSPHSRNANSRIRFPNNGESRGGQAYSSQTINKVEEDAQNTQQHTARLGRNQGVFHPPAQGGISVGEKGNSIAILGEGDHNAGNNPNAVPGGNPNNLIQPGQHGVQILNTPNMLPGCLNNTAFSELKQSIEGLSNLEMLFSSEQDPDKKPKDPMVLAHRVLEVYEKGDLEAVGLENKIGAYGDGADGKQISAMQLERNKQRVFEVCPGE